jgi:YHS domain-containing protein
MQTRRTFLVLSGTALASTAIPAFAAQPPVYGTDTVAINGYDPVAYFVESDAVEGTSTHTTQWNGATWQFASAENRDLFAANPENYAPQYGGYCAYAVSKGYTASTSPNAWTVRDGKLYLNYSRAVRALWSRDIPGNISKADDNWPTVLEA